MRSASAYLSSTGKLGAVLAVAGAATYVALLGIDLIMPLRLPTHTREDKFRLSQAPVLQPQPKAPAFLELTDGAVPARVPNFNYLAPASTRERLLQLKPGTEVSVRRPVEASTWLAPFDVVALYVNGEEVLSTLATVEAHRQRTGGSRSVALYIGLAGAALLAVHPLAHRAPHAA